MSLTVIVEEDKQQVGIAAGNILIPDMADVTKRLNSPYYIGLLTGSSPLTLFNEVIRRQNEFDASLVKARFLDEYIGLNEPTPEKRRDHPESYSTFGVNNLTSKLSPSFGEVLVPQGYMIDVSELEAALKAAEGKYQEVGTGQGKAIIIPKGIANPYLRKIKEEFLDSYISAIAATRIHSWVIGVGENGHVGFHESGIPLELEMLLVKLAEITRKNAVNDKHFNILNNSPSYALSVGAEGIMKYSNNIIVLANGPRKTNAIKEGLLGAITANYPISAVQEFINYKDRHAFVVIDRVAASGLFGQEKLLKQKGIGIDYRLKK
jgi:glucosamine-6-phosphate deaminase